MARIKKYQLDEEVNDKDLLVGTDRFDFNKTKNYKLETLKDYFQDGIAGNQNLDYVASPTQGEVTITNGDDAIIPLADNTNAGLLSPTEKQQIASAIQPNDLSDVATSGDYNDLENLPAYINYFDFSSEKDTNITSSNTWVKLNTGTTSLFSRDGLVHTNNRVTNTSSTKVFKIEGIVSLSAGNNNEVHVAFFKNEQLYPCSEESVVTSSGGRASAIPFHCVIELQQNDYIEVWVKNASSSNNITLKNINVIVTEL